ncbi:MAG TPA: cytochrome P450 [Candidatus Competibacter sp.]|nr:cytochrome P450 [Candidatus Competibacter sp.]
MFNETCHLINRPDAIGQIYQADTERYYKGQYYQLLTAALGDALLSRNGDAWRRQRRLMQPSFQKNRVATWLDVVDAQVDALIARWETKDLSGQPLDVAGEMLQLIQAIIVRVLFGRDARYAVTSAIAESALAISANLMRQILWQPVFRGVLNRLPLPANRRFHGAVRRVKAAVCGAQAGATSDPEAVLSAFQTARDPETGEGMSAAALQDELFNLFLAGHETTAQGLSWTFYFLALHPEHAERVRVESDRVLGGEGSASDRYANLAYTRQVIQESLRLMPPVFMVSRTPLADEPLGGFVIPRDSLVIMSPYVTHRHPEYWDAPESFDPDRFAPGQSANRPRHVYFPFGGGSRICLGKHLAQMEMATIVARIINRFHLTLAPGARVTPETALILRPRLGLPMRVRHR